MQITINIGQKQKKDKASLLPEEGDKPQATKKKGSRKKRVLVFTVVVVVVVVLGGSGTYLYKSLQPKSPFTSNIVSSVQFPLYFPTKLPNDFYIGKNGVSKPQPKVVIITMNGPGYEKLYMSEEAKPSTFNFGGFYKTFKGLKKTNNQYGTIATGKLGNGQLEIGSLATKGTWVIATTVAPIPSQVLTAMMQSLTQASR